MTYLNDFHKISTERKPEYRQTVAGQPIVRRMVDIVRQVDPTARVVLYGSRARGDFHEGSDWDLLVLLDRDRISMQEQRSICDPIYDLEMEMQQVINPVLRTKEFWKKTSFTPFHHNVEIDGINLL